MTRIRHLLVPLAVVGLISTLALGGADPAQAQKRVALIVGNSAYQSVTPLPNPANDAAAVAALFKDAGFDVVDARNNLGNLDFKRAIRDFSNAARGAEVAVVYFAGHGMEVRGTNYLLPVDAKLASDFDVEDEAVSLDRVMQALETARRLRLIILDACRDNPFLKTMQRSLATRAISRGLAKVEPPSTDTLIAFAAKAGSTAEDGTGTNSPFTAALIKHITVPDLDIRLAFGRVRDEVLRNTSNRQEPFVYGSLGGATLALVSAPAQATAPPAAVAPTDPDAVARRDYEFAERVGTKEAWDSFLALHGAGFLADLARAQRGKLDTPAPPAKRGDTAIAAAPPTAQPEPVRPVEKTGPDPAEIARLLQTELKRVGCITGSTDGEWGPDSRRAMVAFNRQAKTKFGIHVASIDALDAARSKKSRVCPLECGAGFRAEGDKCVEVPKTAARPPEAPARKVDRPQQKPAPAAAAPSGGQARVACDRFGCKSVPRNCRVESTFDDRFGSQQNIICP